MLFFALLDDGADDRCKLKLDLPDDKPIVATVRTALKNELGWKAAEMMLFKLKPQVSKQFTQVCESDCVKLLDDEAPCDTSLVFVKRRAPGTKRRVLDDDTPPPRKSRRTTASPPTTDPGSSSDEMHRRFSFRRREYRRSYDRRPNSPFLPAPPPPPPPPARKRSPERWPKKVSPARGPKKLPKAELRQPSRPRAPVVHNLISKQLFLEELQAIIARACASRDRQILPYAIGSIDEICTTHELTLPLTYNWERIRTASEFQALSSSHRALLEPPETPAATPESADLDVPTFDTTVCFVEIGQERLLVFDWYVYALDAVAEQRQKLEDMQPSKSDSPIFYIYGQPRIGKSICVLFLAIAAAYVGEKIYYYCDSKVWQVSADGLARYNLQDLLRSPAASPRSPKCFLFAELRIREQEEVLSDLRAVARHLNLMVVASAVPDVRLIEDRRRSAPAVDAAPFLIVPPPAFHELYALKMLVYPTISRTEFEFRYYLFGPIPRNIISETGPFGYILDGWQQQLRNAPANFPNDAPAPDLLEGEPPRLALLLMPAADGTVTLSLISKAAEAVFLHTT